VDGAGECVCHDVSRNECAEGCKFCGPPATNSLRRRMNAQQLTGLVVDEASNASEVLEKGIQIRCHLVCVGRQLSRLNFNRIPFHVLGILRAIGP
jgi:hypothetical protein